MTSPLFYILPRWSALELGRVKIRDWGHVQSPFQLTQAIYRRICEYALHFPKGKC